MVPHGWLLGTFKKPFEDRRSLGCPGPHKEKAEAPDADDADH